MEQHAFALRIRTSRIGVWSIIIGVSLSEPHIDEFAVNFLYKVKRGNLERIFGFLYLLLNRIVLEVRNPVGAGAVLMLTQSQQTSQSSLLYLRRTVE